MCLPFQWHHSKAIINFQSNEKIKSPPKTSAPSLQFQKYHLTSTSISISIPCTKYRSGTKCWPPYFVCRFRMSFTWNLQEPRNLVRHIPKTLPEPRLQNLSGQISKTREPSLPAFQNHFPNSAPRTFRNLPDPSPEPFQNPETPQKTGPKGWD